MKLNLEVHELRELLKPPVDTTPAELQRRIEQLADYGRRIDSSESKLRDVEERLKAARPHAEAQAVIDGVGRDVEELTAVWEKRPKGTKIPRREYNLWLTKMNNIVEQLQDRMGV